MSSYRMAFWHLICYFFTIFAWQPQTAVNGTCALVVYFPFNSGLQHTHSHRDRQKDTHTTYQLWAFPSFSNNIDTFLLASVLFVDRSGDWTQQIVHKQIIIIIKIWMVKRIQRRNTKKTKNKLIDWTWTSIAPAEVIWWLMRDSILCFILNRDGWEFNYYWSARFLRRSCLAVVVEWWRRRKRKQLTGALFSMGN